MPALMETLPFSSSIRFAFLRFSFNEAPRSPRSNTHDGRGPCALGRFQLATEDSRGLGGGFMRASCTAFVSLTYIALARKCRCYSFSSRHRAGPLFIACLSLRGSNESAIQCVRGPFAEPLSVNEDLSRISEHRRRQNSAL